MLEDDIYYKRMAEGYEEIERQEMADAYLLPCGGKCEEVDIWDHRRFCYIHKFDKEEFVSCL